MPFDGSGFVAVKQSSAWTRLRQFLKLSGPSAKAAPVKLFDPAIRTQPDALTLQVLTVARSLIEDERNWVQRRYETRDGRRCAVGALRSAVRLMNVHGSQQAATSALLSVAMGRGFNDIESMNDNSSHRQVLTAFDEAIGRSSAQVRDSRAA